MGWDGGDVVIGSLSLDSNYVLFSIARFRVTVVLLDEWTISQSL